MEIKQKLILIMKEILIKFIKLRKNYNIFVFKLFVNNFNNF